MMLRPYSDEIFPDGAGGVASGGTININGGSGAFSPSATSLISGAPMGGVGGAAEGSVAFSATGGTLGGGVCSSTNAAVSGGSGRVKYLGYDLL